MFCREVLVGACHAKEQNKGGGLLADMEYAVQSQHKHLALVHTAKGKVALFADFCTLLHAKSWWDSS